MNISRYGINATINTASLISNKTPLTTLILTLQLDAASHAVYDSLRRRYFPAERNQIDAHLTLFHQLPDSPATHQITQQVARSTHPFSLATPTPRSMGRGVAVFFRSESLAALHSALTTAFAPHLIPQDRQRLQPHIVIQNKVTPDVARQTLATIDLTTLPEPAAVGLTLSRYLNGPWQYLADFPFSDPLPR